MYYIGHPGFWGIVFGWLFPVVLIALVVGVLIWAFAGEVQRPPAGGYTGRHDPAADAARYRYAQGLITRDEYRWLMADLGLPLPGDPPPPAAWPPPPPTAAASGEGEQAPASSS